MMATLLSSVAFSAEPGELFRTHVYPDAVLVEPDSDASFEFDVDLIVSGPEGFYHRESFPAGSVVEFDPSTIEQGEVPDGTYKYELRIMGSGQQLIRGIDQPQAASPELSSPHSGAFTIKNGSFVSPDEVEPVAAAQTPHKSTAHSSLETDDADDDGTRDVVTADDQIIQGSLCVGFDCVNGETFSFDTIRLKENNLRIKFEDTSTSSSFPTNDWELTANDSANGGLNRFSILDVTANRNIFTVEAGARSNALYVESGNDVGLGTSNPVLNLHVVDGDSPGLRLEQDASSGFQAQSWDIAGNETNFFVRDATNGSTLPFRVFPGSASSSLVVRDGKVGMGTASPSANMHVKGTSGTTNVVVEEASASTADRTMLNLQNNGGARLVFDDTSATGNDWVFSTTGSDLFRVSKIGSGSTELEVDGSGNLTISGSLTTAANTYPDYVFQEGYKLMPITEVEAFIKANGHLPNVDPAEDIIRNGLDLTEGHIKLMEKVEELTLYTIEQQKLIDDLRSRLDEIQDN